MAQRRSWFPLAAPSLVPAAGERSALRLNRQFRYAIYGALAALFLSGVLWILADGLKDSPEGETWQAMSANLLMVHGGAAMLTLMLLGALVPMHVLRGWRAGKNRV